MSRSALTVVLLICLWPASLVAADLRLSEVLEGVRKRNGQLPGLSLSYKREIITRSMAMLGASTDADLATGRIHFKPPYFLKVQQETPRPETISTDGHILWWYIPQKNQVYRYRSNELGKELRLLSDIFHGLRAVEESFDVILIGFDENGEHQLKLIPNPPWAEIQHIMLSVSQGDYTIRRVEIHNYIGGITRFMLGDLSVKDKFLEDFFRFVVPEGVKVMEQEG